MFVFTFLLCAASSTSQAQLFQCQPSGENEQVFPNIPDMSFDPAEAANSVTGGGSSLTPLQPNMAYIFTIPGVGDDRNCSGNVVSFEYCYRTLRSIGNGQRTAFDFLRLTRSGSLLRIDSRFPVRDNAKGDSCMDIDTNNKVCCTRSDVDMHDVLTTEYTIGIAVSNSDVRPLAFSNSLTEYNVDQYQTAQTNVQEGDEITATPLTSASIPLLRFYLSKQILVYWDRVS